MLDKNAKVVETLTREQVETLRRALCLLVNPDVESPQVNTLCRMALLSLEYSERLTGALRDDFAKAALQGLLASMAHPQAQGSNLDCYPQSAQQAYRIADAMLAARSALPEEPK
jgi:hypothetical protein